MLQNSRAALLGETGREVWAQKESVFFLEHGQEVYDPMDTPFGLKVTDEFYECIFGSWSSLE